MMMCGEDLLKSHVFHVLSSEVTEMRRKVYLDWEEVTSSGQAFQVFGSASGKAQLATVYRLTGCK